MVQRRKVLNGMTGGGRPKDGDEISRMVAAFPQLLELFPLNHFLEELLRAAVQISKAPAGCFVLSSRTLAILDAQGPRIEVLGQEASSTLAAALQDGVVPATASGKSGRMSSLASPSKIEAVPCCILSRPVAYLLISRQAKTIPKLGLLAKLAGYYLHRHEIEGRIERFGHQLVIMGCCPEMFQLQEDVERFARLNEPVLILGESGSGKEVLAMAVHVLSARCAAPFVSVNCAAVPSENLLRDEFFGHRKGAFSGADLEKEGRCEEADGGTLFLDEIGDMSPELQGLLLRTLTTGEVRRLGDTRSSRVDFRLVSATHRDLRQATAAKEFRPDLYYRINAFQFRIPPLREKLSDLPQLADYILRQFSHRNGLPAKGVSAPALRMLQNHDWPGNLRELENVLKRAFALAELGEIEPRHLQIETGGPAASVGANAILLEILDGRKNFWDAAYAPFMHRDMTRADMALLLDGAQSSVGGGLKALASKLGVGPRDYGRFVAFLHRHGFRGDHPVRRKKSAPGSKTAP